MKNKSKKNNSYIKNRKTNKYYNKRKTNRLPILRRNFKYLKGGVTSNVSPNIRLPMVIDRNNIAYSCSPIPTS